MTGLERTDQSEYFLHNLASPNHNGEVQLQLFAGGPEIENAIFGQNGRKSINMIMVERERVAMQGIGNFIAIVRKLDEVVHAIGVKYQLRRKARP